MDAAVCGYALRSDDHGSLTDALAHDLLQTSALKRMRRIGFLGAIDYARRGSGRSAHQRRHNRLEHSVGVALLAQHYARAAELDERDRLKLIAAGLLHDVGHGPLSHTLEPIFMTHFGMGHHEVTGKVIRGEGRRGAEVLSVLRRYRIDPDEVVDMVAGNGQHEYAYLFVGKINLDTLEGITRCRAISGPRVSYSEAIRTVKMWAVSGTRGLPQAEFDDFWQLKDLVYSLQINSAFGLFMDTIAQAWMSANLDKMREADFYLNEESLKRKFPELFKLIVSAAHRNSGFSDVVPDYLLKADVEARRRRYYVDNDVHLSSVGDIKDRYQCSKKSWRVSFGDLLQKIGF